VHAILEDWGKGRMTIKVLRIIDEFLVNYSKFEKLGL
jgi:hypothetical protein